MMTAIKQKGFTLIELMITLGVLAIIVSIAAPSMAEFFDRRRLISATEQVASQLQYARSEAIARSTAMSVNFTTDGATAWSYGMSTTAGCDSTIVDTADPTACVIPISGQNVLKRITSADHPNVSMISVTGGGQITFDPVRGTATASTITLRYQGDLELRVNVGVIGRVSMCSPVGATFVGGYEPC